jgi:hypothetical protein
MQNQFAFYAIKSLQESQASNTVLYRHASEIGSVLRSSSFAV